MTGLLLDNITSPFLPISGAIIKATGALSDRFPRPRARGRECRQHIRLVAAPIPAY